MIPKMIVGALLAMVGMCVNVDVVKDGTAIPNGAVPTVSVAPTIKNMVTMAGSTTTTITILQNAIGAKSVLRIEPEVGLIPQSTSLAIDDIQVFVPNAFDKWDREQKEKAGLVSVEECPLDGSSCEFDEDVWLSHLPTLGELINEYFEPDDRKFFTWLAYCESSADPGDIYSYAMHPLSKATGWFQHLPKFWIERSVRSGFAGFSIDHPVANVGVAAWLFYEDGGAKHWKACTNKYIREVYQQ